MKLIGGYIEINVISYEFGSFVNEMRHFFYIKIKKWFQCIYFSRNYINYLVWGWGRVGLCRVTGSVSEPWQNNSGSVLCLHVGLQSAGLKTAEDCPDRCR
jgi:hypothetical protein